MTWDEFWGEFSKADYASQIEHLSEEDLRREHSIIRQKVISAGSTTTLGVGAAFHTIGASLLGAGVGARRLVYNKHKLNVIETRMNREGWPLDKLRTRDILIGAGPSIAAAVIAPGADHFASHAIGHAAGHGAAQYTTHHAGEAVSHAVHHPEVFTRAVEQGVHDQIHAVGQAIAGNPVPLVPVDAIATNTAWFSGNALGQAAASAAEIKMVESTAKYATKYGTQSFAVVASRNKKAPTAAPLICEDRLAFEELRSQYPRNAGNESPVKRRHNSPRKSKHETANESSVKDRNNSSRKNKHEAAKQEVRPAKQTPSSTLSKDRLEKILKEEFTLSTRPTKTKHGHKISGNEATSASKQSLTTRDNSGPAKGGTAVIKKLSKRKPCPPPNTPTRMPSPRRELVKSTRTSIPNCNAPSGSNWNRKQEPHVNPTIFISFLIPAIMYSVVSVECLCIATLIATCRYLACGWPLTTPLIWASLNGVAWTCGFRPLCFAICILESIFVLRFHSMLSLHSLAIALSCIIQSVSLWKWGGMNAKILGCFVMTVCFSYLPRKGMQHWKR